MITRHKLIKSILIVCLGMLVFLATIPSITTVFSQNYSGTEQDYKVVAAQCLYDGDLVDIYRMAFNVGWSDKNPANYVNPLYYIKEVSEWIKGDETTSLCDLSCGAHFRDVYGWNTLKNLYAYSYDGPLGNEKVEETMFGHSCSLTSEDFLNRPLAYHCVCLEPTLSTTEGFISLFSDLALLTEEEGEIEPCGLANTPYEQCCDFSSTFDQEAFNAVLDDYPDQPIIKELKDTLSASGNSTESIITAVGSEVIEQCYYGDPVESEDSGLTEAERNAEVDPVGDGSEEELRTFTTESEVPPEDGSGCTCEYSPSGRSEGRRVLDETEDPRDPTTWNLRNVEDLCWKNFPLVYDDGRIMERDNKEFLKCMECAGGVVVVDPSGRVSLQGIYRDRAGIYTAIGCIPVDLSNFVSNFILRTGIGIAGGAALLCIIYAAFVIQMHGSNPEKLKEAQDTLTGCIAGLLVIIASVFILRLVGIDILRIPELSGRTGARCIPEAAETSCHPDFYCRGAEDSDSGLCSPRRSAGSLCNEGEDQCAVGLTCREDAGDTFKCLP